MRAWCGKREIPVLPHHLIDFILQLGGRHEPQSGKGDCPLLVDDEEGGGAGHAVGVGHQERVPHEFVENDSEPESKDEVKEEALSMLFDLVSEKSKALSGLAKGVTSKNQ